MNLTLSHPLLRKSQSLIALFLLCALIALLSDNFLTATNLWNVLRQISVNVCIAVGMTLVVLTAGIDLSVGSVLAFSGAICAGLIQFGFAFESLNLFVGFTLLGGILGALLVGLLLGRGPR